MIKRLIRTLCTPSSERIILQAKEGEDSAVVELHVLPSGNVAGTLIVFEARSVWRTSRFTNCYGRWTKCCCRKSVSSIAKRHSRPSAEASSAISRRTQVKHSAVQNLASASPFTPRPLPAKGRGGRTRESAALPVPLSPCGRGVRGEGSHNAILPLVSELLGTRKSAKLRR